MTFNPFLRVITSTYYTPKKEKIPALFIYLSLLDSLVIDNEFISRLSIGSSSGVELLLSAVLLLLVTQLFPDLVLSPVPELS